MTVVVPPGFWEFIQYVSEQNQKVDPAETAKRMSPSSSRSDRVPIPKRTRKVSRYQKVFGKHLKALKKKHPRTDISILMKKAHKMTKRELK